MAISNDWNINYITKQVNHLQWKDEITGTDSSVAEITTIICPAAASITTGQYFTLYSATDATAYYVWYNKNAGGGDPAPTGKTAIAVAIGTSDTAIQVATATASAIAAANTTLDFTASNGGTATVTITNKNKGSCTDAANVDVGGTPTFTVTTQGIGKTVWSVNALYSHLQDMFDDLGQLDDTVPMSAQTPTEYSLINGWFIDEVSIKYLKGGAIKTIGWTTGAIIQQLLPTGYTNVVSSDIGKVVTETDTGDTGTLLFADNTRKRWWIRPDVPGAAGDYFDDPGSAYSIATGTGAGTSTAPSTSGENTWANMFTLGTLETNTAIYIIQDKAKITAWWPVGQIDVLIRVQEAGSTTGANGTTLGTIFIGAREYSKLFDHFVSTGITGGRNPVPLATAADLNNTTGQYQTIVTTASAAIVAGETFTADANSNKQGTITSVTGTFPNLTIQYYLSGTALTAPVNTDACTTSTGKTFTVVTPTSVVADYGTGGTGITLTFADTNKDLNNGNGSKPYDVVIDLKSTKTVAQMYEWLKFITRRGYAASPQQLKTGTGTTADTNIDGEQYIDLLTSFTPVKASPFGTFAGGKFFGAQGVWLDNVPAADAQNYQLIDSNGATQTPPNTVQVVVSSVVAGDRVGVFVLTGAGGTVKKNTYNMTAQSSASGTIIVGTAINSETPQSGVIRIVDSSDPLLAEQQYEYKSWTASTFTLNTLYSSGTPGTATGSSGSSTVLIDTDGTSFISAKIRVGDRVTNQTTGGTATVVSVDSATQLTTTALSVGAYGNGNAYYIETVTDRAYTTSPQDTAFVPIINAQAITTSLSNSLIKDTLQPAIPVLVRVRQGKVILPFEIENSIGNTGMTQAAIRTADTIAT